MDDDYGDDRGGFGGPFEILGAAAGAMTAIIVVSMLAPLLLYVIARWRDNRSPYPDPQLGLKFTLHFFRVQAFQLLLIGTAMLLFSMLGKNLGEGREFIYRPAFGFLVPAGIIFGVTSVMLGKTNNYGYPIVARVWNGYNLLVTGMIGFAVFVMAFQILFQKGKSGNEGRMIWSAVLVYTTAGVALGAMFSRQVLDAPPPPMTPPPLGPTGGDRPEPMQRPLA